MSERRPGKAFVSVSDYLRQEERRDVKHEYFRGEQYAMSGGTARHSQIKVNILTRLHAAARGTGCTVYDSDFKVQPSEEAVYYPDASVVCAGASGDAVLTKSPCLVVEVTSRASARIDRGEKQEQYCQAPTLQGYLIVDQNRKRVTLYVRTPNRAWERVDVEDDGALALPCRRTTLTLDEIYDGVALPPLGVREPDFDEERV